MEPIPPRRKEPGERIRRSDSFESERWPRTPRVLRWAWGGGITVLVALATVGGNDPESRVMIRLMHELIEALDERPRADPDVRARPDAGGSRPE
jgi:hypothetical protein